MKKILNLSFVVVISFLITGCGENEYFCDDGDILKGTSCITKRQSNAQIEYYCDSYFNILEGTRCTVRNFDGTMSSVNVPAKQRYTCSSGYLEGRKCIIETTYNAYIK